MKQSENKLISVPFRIIIRISGILTASFLLLFGIANLINPTVPENYLDQNTRICIMMVIAGVVTAFTVYRPFFGGQLLCLSALGLSFVFNGFFHNPLAPVVMLLGLLNIISGYLFRRKLPEDNPGST
jgi:hypothetical protein